MAKARCLRLENKPPYPKKARRRSASTRSNQEEQKLHNLRGYEKTSSTDQLSGTKTLCLTKSQRKITTGRGRRENHPLPMKTMLTGEGLYDAHLVYVVSFVNNYLEYYYFLPKKK